MSDTEGPVRETGGARSLRDLLRPERIVIPLPGESLADALDRLGRGLAGGRSSAVGVLAGELAAVDASMLVALGEGALLAHLRSESTDEVLVAVGVSERPLDFAPDTARGARVLVLVVSPIGRTRAYLQTLAALGRVLRRKDVAARLASARGPEDVIGIPGFGEPIFGPDLLVRDVMTVDVVAVTPEASLAEVADLLVRRRLRALPVVNERREVMGLVTDRQVMERFLTRLGGREETEEAGRSIAVRDVMERSVLCVKEEEGLRDVAALMVHKDVERLPVCAEGALVGFLTRGDIIRRLLAPRARRARELRGAAAGDGGPSPERPG